MSATGAVILSCFAAVWWLAGTIVTGSGSAPMIAAPLLVTAGISALAWRLGAFRVAEEASPLEQKRRGRWVGIASAAEGIAIFVAVNVLINLGRRDLTAPAVAAIVGLHFLPLAKGLPAPRYYVTAASLLALAAAGGFAPDPGSDALAVCLAAAAILWLTALSVILLPARAGDRAR
jgi:hypothetical protein